MALTAPYPATLRDGTLYINGGIETFVGVNEGGHQELDTITSGITNPHVPSEDEFLILVDMNSSWDSKTNVSITQQNHTMGGSVSGLSFPLNVQKGALFSGWPGSSDLYMYGGTTSGFNESFPGYEIAPTTRNGLWYLDGVSKLWIGVDTSFWVSTTPSWGAFAEDHKSLGFWVGGQLDNGTAKSTQSLNDSTVGTGGLIVLTLRAHGMYNVTVKDSIKSNRQGGGMVYVEGVGEAGILVLLGGRTEEDGCLPMTDIAVFDLNTLDYTSNSSLADNNVWYQQTATGQIPDPRTDFCLVVAYAPDNSSINIYMHGGTNHAESFDDVAILSLPSFTWTAAYNGATTRWGATCHQAGSRQMVTIGGGGNSTNITTDCDPDPNGLSVFDLSALSWGSVYDAEAPPYQVPDALVSVIGGGPSGNATMTEPSNGWTEAGLSSLFGSANSSSSGESSSSRAKTLSGGEIAGIVIGAVAGIAISGACITLFCLRHRRSRNSRDSAKAWESERSAPSALTAQPDGIDMYQPEYSSGGTVLDGFPYLRPSSQPVEME
ncbi:hypothetical protein NA57DRAFT_60877 [Rhizodiscina lignyota]|uniref:Uncharacterized protein n=1 Tax=Rhizodiscina lignyota TaxID=1504668 RepID=A0A9P4I7P9_9PEZI|nr:hypothetical protein NA57DRAFT_60877 [Rhizodiscina lignyota]